jgi:presenilin-like A22 family membrane protease
MKLTNTITIIAIMLFTQISAIFIAGYAKAQNVPTQMFGDPQSLASPFEYVLLLLGFSAVLLILIKFGFKRVIKGVMIYATWASTFWLLLVLLPDGNISYFFLAALPIACAVLVWKYPEWFIIDAAGVILCVMLSAALGSSFGVIPAIILLVIMAVYDFIAVYKTKHMIDLAEYAVNENLPVAFVIPQSANYSSFASAKWQNMSTTRNSEASMLGFGDIVFPSILVVSINVFLNNNYLLLGAMLGTITGIIGIYWLADKYPRAHAGLPFLNSFTLIGFGIAYGLCFLTGAL